MSHPSLEKRPPVWLLILITISGTLAMHMFVPALPGAAQDLGASVQAMQMTISLYIVGLAVGQLIYGPLSDAFGRRPMLIAGLALYCVAGLAAALAPGVQALVAARLIQALGGCAGLALGRAVVRDTAKADDAVGRLALINLVMMIGPGLAPLVGSTLAATLGWRSIFVLLVALGIVSLVFTWRLLPETGRPTGRISAASLLRDYRSLLGSPAFLGFAAGGGCATTSIYAFIAAAPFIFVTQLHRPVHEVGIYLGLQIVGMSAGNAATGRLIGKISSERLLICGSVISVVAASTLLAVVLSGALTAALAVAIMFFFTFGVGMASPVALTRAISVDPERVGSAAGLYGFTQMAVGAVCTSIVGLGRNPALAAAGVLASAALIGQFAFQLALKRDRARRHAG